jgi:hypothetical protein
LQDIRKGRLGTSYRSISPGLTRRTPTGSGSGARARYVDPSVGLSCALVCRRGGVAAEQGVWWQDLNLPQVLEASR